jgi:chlorobactene glucosyltransferase
VELFLSCVWLLIVVLLITRAFRQRGLLLAVAPRFVLAEFPKVAIIVPARDEEANISRCITSLVRQLYPKTQMRVLVADDHSADNTAAIALSLAADHPEIQVLRTPALPARWIGKSHACWIAALAVPEACDWLCFIDADVCAAPDLLTRSLATAANNKIDLLSLSPRQELQSFAERLMIPCGLYILAFCRDLRILQSEQSDDTSVTGQFMLIRREIYRRVGGHAAIHSAVCEDTALARLIKRFGGRVVLGDGQQLLSVRMYTGWRTLWPGIAKNLVEMLGGPLPTLLIALSACAFAWAAVLIPVLDWRGYTQGHWGAGIGLVLALAGSGATLGLHVAGAAHFRIPFWYGLLFPIGYTIGAFMAMDSAWRRWQRRVVWKGRRCP